MGKKICLAALALPALLLAGCAANPLEALLPAENTATVETAAAPAAQSLTVFAAPSLLPALQNYAAAQGVDLQVSEEIGTADLAALDCLPDDLLPALDVSSDTLLAAAAARAGVAEGATALPLGRSLYGYWVNATVVNSLLGEGGLAALQAADWDEWSDFVQTLQGWLAEPGEATVTLNGSDYTLPAEKPEGVTATGVFATPMDRVSGYTAALLAAGTERTEDTLAGPLGGVYSAVALEWENMAQSDETALFRRAKLTDLLAAYGSEACQELVLVPFKCQLEESDLTTEEYNLTGLLDYPVLADVGYLAINSGAEEAGQKAAKSAALWLYSSGEGENTLTETLGVITPWNTASDATTLGAMQVEQAGAGILPGEAFTGAQTAALTENEQAVGQEERSRSDFVEAAVQVLAAAQSEE